MGLFKSLSKGLKNLQAAISNKATKVKEAVSTYTKAVKDAAEETFTPIEGMTQPPYKHYFSKKEWKLRKRRLKMASISRRVNR